MRSSAPFFLLAPNIEMASDDNKSVASGGSVSSTSQVKIDCPYCNKAFQTRAIFNHIYMKHHQQYLENVNAIWLEKADENRPLRIFWTFQNDFGEEDWKTVYACLGTKKTFMTEERCLIHFKKDKKALKDHNKEIKQLKKLFAEKKEKEQDENTKRRKAIKKLEEENDPGYCKALWRYVKHYQEIAEIMTLLIRDKKANLLNQEITFGKRYGWNTWADVLKAYDAMKEYQDEMIKYKICNAKKEWDLYYSYDHIIDAHQEMGVCGEPFDAFRTERNPTNHKICIPSPYDKYRIAEMPECPF